MGAAQPAFLGIPRVCLRVRDLDASERFYRDVFGCEHASAAPPPSRTRHLRLQSCEGLDGPEIELLAGRPQQGLSTLDHFSLLAADVEDVRLIHDRAAAANARLTPPRIDEYGRYLFFVFDPDGHKIEVFAHAPADFSTESPQ